MTGYTITIEYPEGRKGTVFIPADPDERVPLEDIGNELHDLLEFVTCRPTLILAHAIYGAGRTDAIDGEAAVHLQLHEAVNKYLELWETHDARLLELAERMGTN